MKKLLFILLLCYTSASAHPPISIVCDSKGNIYYSDLTAVWKLEPSGRKTIVVPRVHTHELSIDNDDNLYGQNSIYSGEATNKYYHSVWRLNKSSKLDTIIPVTEGFYIENFSFVRDARQNMYWIQHRDNKMAMMKTTPSLKTTKIANADFKNVQWLHVVNNKIYYVQYDNIYCINQQGVISAIAKKLAGNGTKHNSLFGLWSDKAGNIYVANADKQIIQQINAAGKIKTVYTSKGIWFPTGGTFDRKGNLWVLEWNVKNKLQIKQAGKI